MKNNKIIRFNQKHYQALKTHLLSSGSNENQAFALCSKAQNPKCSILICDKLLLPSQNDIGNQSGAWIEPTQKFQSIVYGLACELDLTVVDIHTHPFCKEPRFSTTDDYHGIKNGLYLAKNMLAEIPMAMIVFGKSLDYFAARFWNRKKACFEDAEQIEILGSPIEILNDTIESDIQEQDPYARHRIIPGWQQGRLEQLKVFLCGLGGNGALILESLLALGIGKHGWIKACDQEVLETSNLPRIPYATVKNVGKSKAIIARAYARRKAPKLNVYCFKESIENEKTQDIAKEANIIIGCLDNDGGRKILNGLAARYSVPYIDLGTEIIPEKSSYEAVGQVQIFIPGQTGCLMCSGAIDPSTASLDLLSEEDEKERATVGYIRGTNQTPTPSVLHLNGVTSNLAISQLLRLVFEENIQGKEFLHYNRQKCQLLTASIEADPECPVCGTYGYIGAGDKKPKEKLTQDESETVLISGGKVVAGQSN